MNLKEWKSINDAKYLIAKTLLEDKDIEEMNDLAIQSMGKLNKNAASLVLKYKAGACTDVTGFGILGHLENLAEAQKDKHLEMRINALPVIKNSDSIENHIMNFKLLKGYSAETSGGLMCILNEKNVDSFQKDLQNQFGEKSWVIGEVIRTKENSKAVIKENPEIIQVDAVFC